MNKLMPAWSRSVYLRLSVTRLVEGPFTKKWTSEDSQTTYEANKMVLPNREAQIGLFLFFTGSKWISLDKLYILHTKDSSEACRKKYTKQVTIKENFSGNLLEAQVAAWCFARGTFIDFEGDFNNTSGAAFENVWCPQSLIPLIWILVVNE